MEISAKHVIQQLSEKEHPLPELCISSARLQAVLEAAKQPLFTAAAYPCSHFQVINSLHHPAASPRLCGQE